MLFRDGILLPLFRQGNCTSDTSVQRHVVHHFTINTQQITRGWGLLPPNFLIQASLTWRSCHGWMRMWNRVRKCMVCFPLPFCLKRMQFMRLGYEIELTSNQNYNHRSQGFGFITPAFVLSRNAKIITQERTYIHLQTHSTAVTTWQGYDSRVLNPIFLLLNLTSWYFFTTFIPFP